MIYLVTTNYVLNNAHFIDQTIYFTKQKLLFCVQKIKVVLITNAITLYISVVHFEHFESVRNCLSLSLLHTTTRVLFFCINNKF